MAAHSPQTPGLVAIHVRPGHPDFLDLPWGIPLAEWTPHCGRLVEVQRGLSRHEVRFLGYDPGIYAIKELPEPLAEREYEALKELEERRLPAVTPVGHAVVRTSEAETVGVLITRYLDNSLPYRTLFMQPGLARYRERLLDAMASLLVRLHVAGIYWGDVSLSNTLFRRDAGELQAYLVDAETTEIHDELSKGQRAHDVDIMEENVSGDIADLSAWVELPSGPPLGDIASSIRERYDRLWTEVTREEILAPSESYRIHERIRALNDLGFSVGEIELVATGHGDQLRMRAMVTDRDHHRHQLHSLTGLVAEEHQATQILNEVRELRATLSRELGRSVPLSVAATRWREERFDPAVRRLGALPGAATDVVELYCQVLEHKWFLSEQAKRDVGFEHAVDDFELRFRPRLTEPDVRTTA